uniref:Pentraxin family member n=1 Tax=Neogobius melanostomus TaxID=47308 RepID=A0A8C6UXW8_9GOBI
MVLIIAFLLMTLGKLITCAPQDLSGKMFTFPQKTDTAYVKITTPNLQLGAATVCLRFFTDITRAYGLFSLATPGHPDSFHFVANRYQIGSVQFAVGDVFSYFYGHSFKLNAWQSVCGTWNANTGLTQFWHNGNPGSRRFTTTSHLTGAPFITLGQEQDTYGGGYDLYYSFVGMISDLHMWDYVLTPDQIKNYSYKLTFPSGNVLNWAALDFQVKGRVLVEDEQKHSFK